MMAGQGIDHNVHRMLLGASACCHPLAEQYYLSFPSPWLMKS
ncbi:rCG63679 [Rattus norvegicus]|uniref:RCG63679 n=1 Tax=Rattus norvegicus TaxID=10116 RepID=A6IE99_RAT|nr:rCG63679 [Rattus norvegicus]